jgi:streptomycin 6-kinase
MAQIEGKRWSGAADRKLKSPSGSCTDSITAPRDVFLWKETQPRYVHRMDVTPEVDSATRERLSVRFGTEIETWFEELPRTLTALSGRWRLELEAAIPRGSVSAVFMCQLADGRHAVLKVSPDHARIASEAIALDGWRTPHSPSVLELDERLGAVLIEAIEPGTPLDVSATYPSIDSVAELLMSLHRRADAAYPPVAERVASLFDSTERLYERQPDLEALVPRDLFERGRRLATRLAQRSSPREVLLHGDLTPSNILDGGNDRGLVAIDPAPCLGDAAFDAVDLILWQVDRVETVDARARALAGATEIEADRVVGWCTAFASMDALDLVSRDIASSGLVVPLVELASSA